MPLLEFMSNNPFLTFFLVMGVLYGVYKIVHALKGSDDGEF